MALGITIFASIIIAILLTVAMFYTTKKGYSKNWEEEE